MRREFEKNVALAGIWFMLWFVAAVVANPVYQNISYHGNVKVAFVQFSLAVTGSAFFLWRSAKTIEHTQNLATLVRAIKIFAIASALLPAAPYMFNGVFFWIHMSIATVMSISGFVISYWIAAKIRSIAAYTICSIQTAAMGMMVYTFNMAYPSILWQLQFAYELLLVYCMIFMLLVGRYLIPEPESVNTLH